MSEKEILFEPGDDIHVQLGRARLRQERFLRKVVWGCVSFLMMFILTVTYLCR